MPPDLPNRDWYDRMQRVFGMFIGTIGFAAMAVFRSGDSILMAFGLGALSLICAIYGFYLLATLKN